MDCRCPCPDMVAWIWASRKRSVNGPGIGGVKRPVPDSGQTAGWRYALVEKPPPNCGLWKDTAKWCGCSLKRTGFFLSSSVAGRIGKLAKNCCPNGEQVCVRQGN